MDRLRTTGDSHGRCMIAEVMGRHVGWIALHSGMAAGAHAILIPEQKTLDRADLRMGGVGSRSRPRAADRRRGGLQARHHGRRALRARARRLRPSAARRHRRPARARDRGAHRHRDPRRRRWATSSAAAPRPRTTACSRPGTGWRRSSRSWRSDWGRMVALRGTQIVHVPFEDALGRLKAVPQDRYDEAAVLFGIGLTGILRGMTSTDIAAIVRAVRLELSPAFEERLRAMLADQDREWLIDQIVRLTLDQHSLQEIDRRSEREAKERARSERLDRVRALGIDHAALAAFVAEHRGVDRAALLKDGRLVEGRSGEGDLPARIGAPQRRGRGASATRQGHPVRPVVRRREHRHEPRAHAAGAADLRAAAPKARALDFMRASTELAAAGTWQDPDSVSNDERADNVLLEVQYGDTEGRAGRRRHHRHALAHQQPRGERAGALRPDDRRGADDADHLSAGWSAAG